ncbi:MAG: sigma 54-interacting transcriptional regulator, partial [Gammaproteobacteria bacterium]
MSLRDMIIGESPEMQSVFRAIPKIASSDAFVLIQGESGSGKELIARAIHQRSPRSAQPFFAVNCAALSEGLIQSELFGHEKGAFTGAHRRKIGRFETAHVGTILLEE